MRTFSLIAATAAILLVSACSKVEEAPAAAEAPATESAAPGAQVGEVADIKPQELVNGQLPGYNPNLVVKDVKWEDPAQKAAWEARKAELKRLRAEGKLPVEGQ